MKDVTIYGEDTQEEGPLILRGMPLRSTLCQRIAQKDLDTAGLLTCNSLMAPGSTVYSATAIVFDIGKRVESTILTVPPFKF